MGSVMTKLEGFKQVQFRWIWWFTKRGARVDLEIFEEGGVGSVMTK